jgi:hypothetical protein
MTNTTTTVNLHGRAFFVYRQHPSTTYGVYLQPGRDGSGQELLEGGFFSRAAAEDALRDYRLQFAPAVVKEG